MGFESGFNSARKKTAQEIKTARLGGDSVKAREIMNVARRHPEYQDQKALHQIQARLSTRVTEEVFATNESEHVPRGWRLEHIGGTIPGKYQKVLDIAMLNEANEIERRQSKELSGVEGEVYQKNEDVLMKMRTGHVYEELFSPDEEGISRPNKEVHEKIDRLMEEETAQAQAFWDELTQGRFLDPHNLNHFIGAETTRSLSGVFDIESQVEPGINLWTSSHGNGYGLLYERQLVLFSPRNPKLRAFMEKYAYTNPFGTAPNSGSILEAFMKNESIPKYGEYGAIENWAGIGINSEYRDLVKKGHGYSWADLADCIIDLRAGKRFVREYSEEELQIAEESAESYRRGHKVVRHES
jgi:hypothetical protein